LQTSPHLWASLSVSPSSTLRVGEPQPNFLRFCCIPHLCKLSYIHFFGYMVKIPQSKTSLLAPVRCCKLVVWPGLNKGKAQLTPLTQTYYSIYSSSRQMVLRPTQLPTPHIRTLQNACHLILPLLF
jgi:hypothetical protein